MMGHTKHATANGTKGATKRHVRNTVKAASVSLSTWAALVPLACLAGFLAALGFASL